MKRGTKVYSKDYTTRRGLPGERVLCAHIEAQFEDHVQPVERVSEDGRRAILRYVPGINLEKALRGELGEKTQKWVIENRDELIEVIAKKTADEIVKAGILHGDLCTENIIVERKSFIDKFKRYITRKPLFDIKFIDYADSESISHYIESEARDERILLKVKATYWWCLRSLASSFSEIEVDLKERRAYKEYKMKKPANEDWELFDKKRVKERRKLRENIKTLIEERFKQTFLRRINELV